MQNDLNQTPEDILHEQNRGVINRFLENRELHQLLIHDLQFESLGNQNVVIEEIQRLKLSPEVLEFTNGLIEQFNQLAQDEGLVTCHEAIIKDDSLFGTIFNQKNKVIVHDLNTQKCNQRMLEAEEKFRRSMDLNDRATQEALQLLKVKCEFYNGVEYKEKDED